MRPALIAVSHGTSSLAGQAAVAGLVDAVRRRLPDVVVSEAFVDVQEPSPDTVLDNSSDPAVVVPLLLAPGFHVHVDIARSVAGRDATTAPVLGPSGAITAILLDRLRAAGLRGDDAVVLGVAGSSDVRAHQSVDRAAARLAMRLGREVVVGHLGGTGRRLGDVVAEVGASGRRVCWHPGTSPTWCTAAAPRWSPTPCWTRVLRTHGSSSSSSIVTSRWPAPSGSSGGPRDGYLPET